MSEHANYVIEINTPEQIVIRDIGPWDQHLTVTNDAEYVVEELWMQLGNRRLLYFDSENELSELVIDNGKFFGFKPIRRPS